MIKKTLIKRKYIKKKVTPKKQAPKAQPVVFYGTTFEQMVQVVCRDNKFPFDFRRAKIGGYVVDFINREKRLILEVYNPDREWALFQARMKAFIVQKFNVKYITKDKLSQRNGEKLLTGSIKRFLE